MRVTTEIEELRWYVYTTSWNVVDVCVAIRLLKMEKIFNRTCEESRFDFSKRIASGLDDKTDYEKWKIAYESGNTKMFDGMDGLPFGLRKYMGDHTDVEADFMGVVCPGLDDVLVDSQT